MPDVFLSYAREDAVRARQVAQALEQTGLEVFWDNEIPPGATWADHIELKLSQCKALIVLWSENSTKSQSVREEARLARDKGLLIPVAIDGASPPFGFGEVQTADLSHWSGDQADPSWRRVVDAVSRVAQASPAPTPPPVTRQPTYTLPPEHSAPEVEQKRSSPWIWIGGGVAAAVLIIAVIGFVMGGAGQAPSSQSQVQAATGAAPQAGGGVNYQQQILDRLAQVEQHFATQGFQQIAAPASGQMPAGQIANYPVTLEAGGEYRIIGVCDNDCGDFNLILYDQNNNVVSQDVLQDATPVVAVAPQWTGPFTVQAVMQNCTVSPCYYALVLYGRPLAP